MHTKGVYTIITRVTDTIVMLMCIVFALLTIKRKNFELFMPLMAEQTLFLKGEK